MRTIDDMVRSEVICCLSHMVSTLANGEYALPAKTRGMVEGADELGALCAQASELCYPLQDWESAALEAGWTYSASRMAGVPGYDHSEHGRIMCDGWQDLCEQFDIEPHEREIFEHWAVTEWLADKLDAMGERIDRDFAGLCVWGRTTSGQGIASDSVILDVYAELTRAA